MSNVALADYAGDQAEYAAIAKLWQEAAGNAPEQETGRRRVTLAASRAAIFRRLNDYSRSDAEYRVVMQLWPTLRPNTGTPTLAELREYDATLDRFIRSLMHSERKPPATRLVLLAPPENTADLPRYVDAMPEWDDVTTAAAAGGIGLATGYLRPSRKRAGLGHAAVAGPAAVAVVVGLADVEQATVVAALKVEHLTIRRRLADATGTTDDRRSLAEALERLSDAGPWWDHDRRAETWADQELVERAAVAERPDATERDWNELVGCRLQQAIGYRRTGRSLESLFAIAAAGDAARSGGMRFGPQAFAGAEKRLAEQRAYTLLARRDHRGAAAAAAELARLDRRSWQLLGAANMLAECYSMADEANRPTHLARLVALLDEAITRDRDRIHDAQLDHAFDAVRSTPEFQQLLARYAPKTPRPAN